MDLSNPSGDEAVLSEFARHLLAKQPFYDSSRVDLGLPIDIDSNSGNMIVPTFEHCSLSHNTSRVSPWSCCIDLVKDL